jgi:hypothetical protein
VAERRDPQRPRRPGDRPAFHFDTGVHGDRQDHVDDFVDNFVDHVDTHEDTEFWDGVHNDSATGNPQQVFDRVQSLIEALEQKLRARQQRLERLVDERLKGIERETGRILSELGDHVHEIGRRLDDRTADRRTTGRRTERGP